MLKLAGDQIPLRDFLPHDRKPFLALEAEEAMFTYMKFRLDRSSAELVLPRLLEEAQLDPRPSYNLVVEDREGFSGWAGIDSIEGTDSGQFGWYLCSVRWGRGYATEATDSYSTSASPYCNERQCGQRQTLKNLASVRVLEKSGLHSLGLTSPADTWRGSRPRLLFNNRSGALAGTAKSTGSSLGSLETRREKNQGASVRRIGRTLRRFGDTYQ